MFLSRPASTEAAAEAAAPMVEQSDRAPLLDWEEIPPPDPNQATPPPQPPPAPEKDAPAEKSSYPPERPPASTAAGTGWSSPADATTLSPTDNKARTAVVPYGDKSPGRPRTAEPSGHRREHSDRNVPFPVLSVRDQWEEKDQIVAVFVVTFDTRSGEQSL